MVWGKQLDKQHSPYNLYSKGHSLHVFQLIGRCSKQVRRREQTKGSPLDPGHSQKVGEKEVLLRLQRTQCGH